MCSMKRLWMVFKPSVLAGFLTPLQQEQGWVLPSYSQVDVEGQVSHEAYIDTPGEGAPYYW